MKLNRIPSQIIVLLYLAVTFGLRFTFESQLAGHYWVSLMTGALGLLLLYALVKSGFLNPGWFWFEKEA